MEDDNIKATPDEDGREGMEDIPDPPEPATAVTRKIIIREQDLPPPSFAEEDPRRIVIRPEDIKVIRPVIIIDESDFPKPLIEVDSPGETVHRERIEIRGTARETRLVCICVNSYHSVRGVDAGDKFVFKNIPLKPKKNVVRLGCRHSVCKGKKACALEIELNFTHPFLYMGTLVDPLTRKLFSAGDDVVRCRHDLVYNLRSTWQENGGCGVCGGKSFWGPDDLLFYKSKGKQAHGYVDTNVTQR